MTKKKRFSFVCLLAYFSGYFKIVKISLNSVFGLFQAETNIKLRMTLWKLWAWNILLIQNGQLPVDVFSIVGNLADFLTFCRHFYCSVNNIKVVKQEQLWGNYVRAYLNKRMKYHTSTAFSRWFYGQSNSYLSKKYQCNLD